MKLKLDERAIKFKKFLDLMNLLDQNIESNKYIELIENLISLRSKLENTNWDQDDETFEQIDNYWAFIDEETKKFFPDNKNLCLFLFGTESIESFRDELIKGEAVISRQLVGKNLCKALASFQNFVSNYQTFPDLMFNVEKTVSINESLQKIGNNKTFSMSWKGISVVLYSLDEKGQLEISLNQNDFFYGYRDFERIFRCKRCKNYFLARRKDANFCSKTCRYSHKQKTRLEDPVKREKHLELKKKYYQETLKRRRNNSKIKRDKE